MALGNGQRRRLRDERPELPATFVAIVERALATDARNRYSTASELEDALRQFVSVRPGSGEIKGQWQRSPWAHGWRVWLLIGLVAAGAAGGGRWLTHRLQSTGSTTALPGIRSVTVAPFVNISGDSANDYFAAALTDLLVSRLGSIKALHVSSGGPPGDRRQADGLRRARRICHRGGRHGIGRAAGGSCGSTCGCCRLAPTS